MNPIFNDQYTSDVILSLTINKVKWQKLWVNKLLLCANSLFFQSMFTLGLKESSENIVSLDLEDEVMAQRFIGLIRCVYSNFDNFLVDDLLEFFLLAEKYNIVPAIKYCHTRFAEIIIDLPLADRILSLPVTLHTEEINPLIASARKFIYENYYKCDTIYKAIENREISGIILLEIITNPQWKVNSENDVLYLVLYWWTIDKKDRLEKLLEMLPHVRFPHLTGNYLQDVVKHTIDNCNEYALAVTLGKLLDCAQWYKILGPERIKFMDTATGEELKRMESRTTTGNKYVINSTLGNLNRLPNEGALYTNPRLLNGYPFRLGIMPDQEGDFTTLTLYLFVCNNKIIASKYYLPLTYELWVKENDKFVILGKNTRIFSTDYGYGFSLYQNTTLDSFLEKKKIIVKAEITFN